MDEHKAIVIFKKKNIRRTWHNDEWWFSVVDVITALADSAQLAGYLKNMRRRVQN